MNAAPERPARSKRLIIWLALAVLLIGVIVIAGKPTYRALRTMRANSFITEAETLARQKQDDAARQKAAAAARLGANDPDIIRRLALFFSDFDPPRAVEFWKALLARGMATEADRVRFARLAMRLDSLDYAKILAQELVRDSPGSIQGYLILADVAERYGTPDFSEKSLREGLLKNPENPVLSNRLAALLSRFPDPEKQKEAIALLEKTSLLSSEEGRNGLLLLLQSPAPSQIRMAALDRLRKHPMRVADDDLAILGAELSLNPEKKAELLQAALATHKGAEPQAKVQFGRWLNRNQHSALVLELFDLKEALSRQDIFLIYVDAMAFQGKWQEVNALFRDQSIPLDPAYALAFRARIARELGDEHSAKLYWQQAAVAAGRSRETLEFLASYAERSREPAQALKAWRALTQDPVVAPEAYRELVRFQERHGSTREIRDAVLEMLGVLPESAEAKNDLAYLNLLLNEQVEQARQMATELVDRFPEFLAYRTTLALAALRLNDPQAAVALIGDLAIDWRQAQPGWQAVRVAALGAGGRTEEAREALKAIDLKRLKPEENNLIVPYR